MENIYNDTILQSNQMWDVIATMLSGQFAFPMDERIQHNDSFTLNKKHAVEVIWLGQGDFFRFHYQKWSLTLQHERTLTLIHYYSPLATLSPSLYVGVFYLLCSIASFFIPVGSKGIVQILYVYGPIR